ncbi:MAG: hypothetical protein COZ33_05835 [Nitrospirae bacterium CG_4_10_14_3_um_filter_70_108]|nr:MAG: hypothetical protein COZ33_05835 [Nitrospirae bacterium CG_4_10_14_3_um_filter_70_108]
MRLQVLRWVAVVLVLSPLCWAMADEAAQSVPVAPQRVEMTTPAAPVQMRAADAEALVHGLHIAPAAPAAAAPAAAEPQAAGGVTRTIHVAAPQVVNRSPYFQFRAVTQEGEGVTPERSMAERRASVEAYRQSLHKKPGR